MPRLDSSWQTLLILMALVAISLVAAFLLLLKGSAEIKQKGVQFGGAAAVFFTVFVLLVTYWTEIWKTTTTPPPWPPTTTSIPPAAPVLQVRAKSPFHIGESLEVRIKVLRLSHLFCFSLDQAGKEATLLYPTYGTQREHENLFGPSDGEMKFPHDFKSLKDAITFVPFEEPDKYSFHCIATEQPLRDPLKTKWFENTAAQFVHPNEVCKACSVAPDMTYEILTALRKSEGYAEDSATIEIVSE